MHCTWPLATKECDIVQFNPFPCAHKHCLFRVFFVVVVLLRFFWEFTDTGNALGSNTSFLKCGCTDVEKQQQQKNAQNKLFCVSSVVRASVVYSISFRHYFNLRNLIYAFLCEPHQTPVRRLMVFVSLVLRLNRLQNTNPFTMYLALVTQFFFPAECWLVNPKDLLSLDSSMWLCIAQHITYDLSESHRKFYLQLKTISFAIAAGRWFYSLPCDT